MVPIFYTKYIKKKKKILKCLISLTLSHIKAFMAEICCCSPLTSSLQLISSPVPAVDIQNLMLVTVFFNSILYNLNFRFVCVCVLFGCLEKLKEKREMRDNLLV